MISNRKTLLQLFRGVVFSLFILTALSGYGYELVHVNCPGVQRDGVTYYFNAGTPYPIDARKFKNMSVGYCEEPNQSGETFRDAVSSGKAWPAGNYPAPVFEPESDVSINGLIVPAGRYSLYFVPSDDAWKLILNKQTQQSAGSRDESQDLGGVAMSAAPAPEHAVEDLSIIFRDGPLSHADGLEFRLGELHFIWGNIDVFVLVTPLHTAEAVETQSAPRSESPTAH